MFVGSATSSESKEQPKELIVDVLDLPASCDAKAATGDKISMHYVCFLLKFVFINIPSQLQYDRVVPCFQTGTNLTLRALLYHTNGKLS